MESQSAFMRWQWIAVALVIPQIEGQKVSDIEWEHFNLVNNLRAQGITCPQGSTYPPNSQPLVFECKLWKASQLHSQDMADKNYFSHSSQDGRSPWDRARAVGASANGENIAAGASTAQGVLNQWQRSDGHCRNMGNAGFRFFAIGYGSNPSSTYRNYWTQMFGSSPPSGGTDTSCYPAGAGTGAALTTTTDTTSIAANPCQCVGGSGYGNTCTGTFGEPWCFVKQSRFCPDAKWWFWSWWSRQACQAGSTFSMLDATGGPEDFTSALEVAPPGMASTDQALIPPADLTDSTTTAEGAAPGIVGASTRELPCTGAMLVVAILGWARFALL